MTISECNDIHLLGKGSRANTETSGIPNTPLKKNYVQHNMRWAEHVTRIGERYIQSFDGKPAGKGPLGRPMRRWEDDIKMDLKEK
jgi:hypothetical protein